MQSYDVIIIGGGPAGLSAAINLARAKRQVVLLESGHMGGQIAISSAVANYPGVYEVEGSTLSETMYQQAKNFGAEFCYEKAIALDLLGERKIVRTEQNEFVGKAVILATGAVPKRAGFLGEKKYGGKGVSYCATCDGALYRNMDLFVVGGGDAAAEEALYLSRFAKKVTLCVRGDCLSCEKSNVEKITANDKIKVRYTTEIIEANGENRVETLRLKNHATGEIEEFQAEEGEWFGIFVFAGYAPQTELFQNQLMLTEGGYLKTNRVQQTNISGVFGAGDVCDKSLRQAITAASDGAVAAHTAEHYLTLQHTQTAATPEKSEAHNDFSVQLEKIKKKIILLVNSDETEIAEKMDVFARRICKHSPNLVYQCRVAEQLPGIELLREDGTSFGVTFHVVPDGRELQAFVEVLLYAGGANDVLDSNTVQQIARLQNSHLEIGITLSCAMCPPTVVAAGQLAIQHPQIRTNIYDLTCFPGFGRKYGITSVPGIVINGEFVGSGKKSIADLIAICQKMQ